MKKIILLLALCCNFALAADADLEYRVAHIIVRDEKTALDLIRKLKDRADFAQLARQHSEDLSSADAGGDMGWFTLKQMKEPFRSVTSALKSREFSKTPVESDSFWYVLQVNRTRKSGETFEPEMDPGEWSKTMSQSEVNLKAIQSLRTNPTPPPFATMPPATSIVGPAPPGATDYKTPFQTSSRCIFFYEKSDTLVATHADWKGPECKGKVVNGKGVLRITGQITRKDGGKMLVQHEMRGMFINGLLFGAGEKTNYHYQIDKTPIMDSYRFSGWFEHGFLSGQGKRTWIGPASDRPNAVELRGNFIDGVPDGLMRQIRSEPYEGARGDVIPLVYSPKGVYIEQAKWQRGRVVEGKAYFDSGEWTMYVETWNSGKPVAAVFTRTPDYKNAPNFGSIVMAACNDWRLEGAAWGCQDGTVRYMKTVSTPLLQAQTAFSLSMHSGSQLLNVISNPPVHFGLVDSNAKPGMRCNADWSVCTGQAQFEMIGPYEWRGETTYRNGEIKPSGPGALLATRGEDFMNSRLEVIAECRRLSSPTECESGIYKSPNGGSFEGPFRLKNVTYGPRSDSPFPGYVRQGEIELELYGWGRTTFPNGRWANVRRKDGEIVEVGNCEDPASDESVNCTLRGQTVVFNYPRRAASREERRPASQPERSWTPERVPERFVPTPVPQRQPYVLPGMR